MKTKKFIASRQEKKMVTSILVKLKEENKRNEVMIMSLSRLFKLLSKREQVLAKKFMNVNPLIYGFKGCYLGVQRIPNNLVTIRNQKYKSKEKIKKIANQYLPKPAYLAYIKLNNALYKEKKKRLLVDSGYRSPAYQLITFLWYLNFYKFNFLKTIKRVAIPGYSEHSLSKCQAVDFITFDGIPKDEKPLDFEKTIEYKWLLKNANKFDFYQSYPKNNKLGVMFEPWHWQFKK